MAGASGPNLIDSGLVLALDVADSYNFNLTVVEVLVVAGGGGGGSHHGGGGGAGGLIYNSNFTVTPGSALTVTVGNGGAGGGNNAAGTSPVGGVNGENSVFGSLTAIGGGGGASYGYNGNNGGSGGGSNNWVVASGGSATSGQGFSGGSNGGEFNTGGGGGGAGGTAKGLSNNSGGDGLYFAQFSSVGGSPAGWFSGGGAAGVYPGYVNDTSYGYGGLGGGGNGGNGPHGSGTGKTNGTANTGGGGGGSADLYQTGASGGSGIVIVRYLGPQRAIGGTVTSVGGYTIHTFTTVGSTTFTPLVATNNSAILGLADLSNNNRFATTEGSPIYSNINNGVVNLDGSDEYVYCGTFFNYQTFTISLWVNCGTTQTTYADIFDNNHTGTQNFVFQQNANDLNNYAFGVIDGSGTISASGTIVFTANTWYHVAFTFSPSSRVIAYVNGEFHSQGNLAGGRTINYVSPSLALGRWQWGGSRYWNGKIGSFNVFDRILTASEIKQNYNTIKKRFVIDYGNIIRNGLVLHLDASSYSGSGSTWYDLSGQGNNGTINGATYDSSYGGIMVFDGSDSIDCGSPSNLSITVGTVCAWFKKPHGSGYKGLVDKGRDGYGAWSLNVDETANTATFKAHISGNSRLIVASSSYGNDTWTYVCGVYDGTNLLIYQNGTLSNSASYSGTIGTNSVSVRVGSANDGLYFNGNIAHASIYNRALSASEILQNFNALRTRFGI
jgi:hypothetical protein